MSPENSEHTSIETDYDVSMRAELALEAGRMGSWTWDVERDEMYTDVTTATLMGLEFEKQPWSRSMIQQNINPEDLPAANAAMKAALESEDVYEIEIRVKSADTLRSHDGYSWLRNRARVTARSEAGLATRFVGVLWDITKEKKYDEALKRIAGDMDHRAKNAFAVIRAMINIGKREAADIDSFAETLRGHVEAMAGAHALAAKVSRSNDIPRARVPIIELIRLTLHPWIVQFGQDQQRIVIEGDPSLTVGSEAATSMSMMIHELASHSAKQGALCPEGGTLRVTLTNPNKTDYDLQWIETFKDPKLATATEPDGFGSLLLTHCVATLKGKIKRDQTDTGLHVGLRMPF